MALPQMDTAWRPDFALGAYVSGQNAANSESSAQEELIKQYLANQREVQSQPLDIGIKQTEAERARMARLPEMLEAYKRLYMGQADSTEAAGKKAMDTVQGEIDYTNKSNKNKISVEDLLAKLNELKKSGVSGRYDQTPASTPDIPADVAQPGFSWQVNPQEQLDRDNKALGLMQQELEANPNDVSLVNNMDNLLARMNSGQAPQQPGKIAFKTTRQIGAPDRNVTSGNPEYERIMGALMDTPEFRQKLIQGDQKSDSAEYMKQLGLLQAELRASKENDVRREKLIELQAWAYRVSTDPSSTPEMKAQASQILNQIKLDKLGSNPASYNPVVDIEVPSKGKLPTQTALEKAEAASRGELSTKDKQALEWANSNPTDPRAIAIKKKLGR